MKPMTMSILSFTILFIILVVMARLFRDVFTINNVYIQAGIVAAVVAVFYGVMELIKKKM